MNKFGFYFLDEYKCEYVCAHKNGRIWLQIHLFGLIFANTNMNTNIIAPKIKIKYIYIYVYGYESYKSMTYNANMCYKIQFMVLG